MKNSISFEELLEIRRRTLLNLVADDAFHGVLQHPGVTISRCCYLHFDGQVCDLSRVSDTFLLQSFVALELARLSPESVFLSY